MPIDYASIIAQITRGTKDANAANLERYKELLAHIDQLGQQTGAAGTYGDAQALMENIGTAARSRIQEQAVKTGSQVEQDLVSRGLGSTTIRTSAQRGVMSDTQRALAEQSEGEAMAKSGLLERRAGMEAQIGGMKAGAIEARQDVGPDLGMYASLLQAAAAGDQSTGRRTVTSTGGSLGPGIITRTKAAQAANAAAAAGGGGSGGGGLRPSSGGGGGSGGGSGGGGGSRGYLDPPTGRFTGLTGPGQIAYGGGSQAGGNALILSPQGPVPGVQQGGGWTRDTAGNTLELSPGGAVTPGSDYASGEDGIGFSGEGDPTAAEMNIIDTARQGAGAGDKKDETYAEYVKRSKAEARAKGKPSYHVSPMYWSQVWGKTGV